MAALNERVLGRRNFTNHRQLNCKLLVNAKVPKDTFRLCHFTKHPSTGSPQMTDKKKLRFKTRCLLHQLCMKRFVNNIRS